jgi:hypothetical protein
MYLSNVAYSTQSFSLPLTGQNMKKAAPLSTLPFVTTEVGFYFNSSPYAENPQDQLGLKREATES